MFREPCGFNHTREARRFPSLIIFQPAERQFDALRPADWLRTNARFQLIDHIVVVQTVFATPSS